MRFKHDCEHCKPLGEFGEADLYFCDTPWIGVTVVARYGDEESDYVSGMELAKYQTDLKEAKKRAIADELLERPNVQGDRRCAASSRSVQRAKRTGSTAGLGLGKRLACLPQRIKGERPRYAPRNCAIDETSVVHSLTLCPSSVTVVREARWSRKSPSGENACWTKQLWPFR